MRAFILAISLLGFSLSAHAFWDIQCKFENCLKHGWDGSGPQSLFEVKCRNQSCEDSGWNFSNRINGFRSRVECEGDGCFVTGWTEWDRRTGFLISEVTCRSEGDDKEEATDCLKWGWQARTANGSSVTKCRQRDCRKNGWTTRYPMGKSESIECKDGGCFVEGWYIP